MDILNLPFAIVQFKGFDLHVSILVSLECGSGSISQQSLDPGFPQVLCITGADYFGGFKHFIHDSSFGFASQHNLLPGDSLQTSQLECFGLYLQH